MNSLHGRPLKHEKNLLLRNRHNTLHSSLYYSFFTISLYGLETSHSYGCHNFEYHHYSYTTCSPNNSIAQRIMLNNLTSLLVPTSPKQLHTFIKFYVILLLYLFSWSWLFNSQIISSLLFNDLANFIPLMKSNNLRLEYY